MPRTVPRRPLVAAPVVLVVVLVAATAPAFPHVPAGVQPVGTAAEPRAEPEPFDLTYLPRPLSEVGGIIAFRPAALFAHPALHPYVVTLNGLLGRGAGMYGIHGGGPGVENIESAILCGHITISITPNTDPATKDERPNSMLVGGDGGFVVRTTKPYNWAAAVRRWFPAARADEYRGTVYQTVSLDPRAVPPPVAAFLGALKTDLRFPCFAADDRTLVFDSEDRIRGLIDRLKDRKRDSPPPWWEKVSRATVAVAVDNRNKKWIGSLPSSPAPELPYSSIELFKTVDHFAVGMDFGSVTRFKVVATCRHQFAAKAARTAWRRARGEFADCFAASGGERPTPTQEAATKLTDALLLDGKTTPTPLGFEYVGEVPDDLLGRLIRLESEPAPPPVLPQTWLKKPVGKTNLLNPYGF